MCLKSMCASMILTGLVIVAVQPVALKASAPRRLSWREQSCQSGQRNSKQNADLSPPGVRDEPPAPGPELIAPIPRAISRRRAKRDQAGPMVSNSRSAAIWRSGSGGCWLRVGVDPCPPVSSLPKNANITVRRGRAPVPVQVQPMSPKRRRRRRIIVVAMHRRPDSEVIDVGREQHGRFTRFDECPTGCRPTRSMCGRLDRRGSLKVQHRSIGQPAAFAQLPRSVGGH